VEAPGVAARTRRRSFRVLAEHPQRVVERWLEGLTARPRRVQAVIDAAAVGFGLLLLPGIASPEVLFHCIFVLLALNAFLFGLRPTLLRIAIVSVVLVSYEQASAIGIDLAPMDLAEWPLMFVIAVLVAWMADRRAATSREYAALFRQASDRLVTLQDDEQRRTARDLHDGLGQTLTALTLTLDAAAAARDPIEASGRILAARELAAAALGESRQLATRLRPARLEQVGLLSAVRHLADRAGFPVVVEAAPATVERAHLSPATSAEVYRIVQEALSNAARHSGAPGATVSFEDGDGLLRVSVSDRGHGFDPAAARGRGLGLAGMHERAGAIGARLVVESTPSRGTRVFLEVPTTARAPAG
jgi:signal transduction histidine kinase